MSHEPVRHGFEVLDAMVPPDPGVPRVRYRAFMTDDIGSLDWDDLRCVCAALDCDVTRVVGRAMDYQIARARRLRGAPGGRNMEPSRPRLGKAPAPGQDTDQGKATPEGGGAPCGNGPSGAGACCLCGRRFPFAGTRGPWKCRTVRRVSSAPPSIRLLVAERGIADKDAMLCRECRMDLLDATGLEKGRSGLDSSTKSRSSISLRNGHDEAPDARQRFEGEKPSQEVFPPQSRPDLPFSKPADLLEGVQS